ncbi:MAG: DUF423 domain-containing protein [Pirellulales bacterium]
MTGSRWIAIGAGLGALGVALGAFGAHFLRDRVSSGVWDARQLEIFEVGVRYQMYHALALVVVGLWAERRPSRRATAAGACFLFGIVVFSGLLYALAFTQIKVLGAIVPIGGMAFIVGWLALAAAAATQARAETVP